MSNTTDADYTADLKDAWGVRKHNSEPLTCFRARNANLGKACCKKRTGTFSCSSPGTVMGRWIASPSIGSRYSEATVAGNDARKRQEDTNLKLGESVLVYRGRVLFF